MSQSPKMQASLPNHLRVWHFRLTFTVQSKLVFPSDKATNTIRGAWGLALRQLDCDPACSNAQTCPKSDSCAYQRIFEPRRFLNQELNPSGFADPPRPFVLRAQHLDGRTFEPLDSFDIHFILFDGAADVQLWCIQAFEKMAANGIGPNSGTARLTQVIDVSTGDVVWEAGGWILENRPGMQIQIADPASQATSVATVRFVTPTELKSGDTLLYEPHFGVLLRRLRDRISNLRAFYQGGPLDLDFQDWGRAADQVKIMRSSLRQAGVERRSSKTGQRHLIGGFVGEVEYAGDLERFVGMLKAGEWTGVGRQTVWGKGQLKISLRKDKKGES